MQGAGEGGVIRVSSQDAGVWGENTAGRKGSAESAERKTKQEKTTNKEGSQRRAKHQQKARSAKQNKITTNKEGSQRRAKHTVPPLAVPALRTTVNCTPSLRYDMSYSFFQAPIHLRRLFSHCETHRLALHTLASRGSQ